MSGERCQRGGECPTVTPGRGCRMQMPGGSERCLSAAAAAARCSIDRDQSGRSPLSANAGHLPSHKLDTCPLSKVSKRLFSGPRNSFYCLGHFKMSMMMMMMTYIAPITNESGRK